MLAEPLHPGDLWLCLQYFDLLALLVTDSRFVPRRDGRLPDVRRSRVVTEVPALASRFGPRARIADHESTASRARISRSWTLQSSRRRWLRPGLGHAGALAQRRRRGRARW